MFILTEGRDIACEKSGPLLLTMNCGERSIEVTYANWGRTEPYDVVCPHPRGGNEDLHCDHSISDQLESCDGLTKCQTVVDRPNTDPCYETSKYAEVRYICQGEKYMNEIYNLSNQLKF